MYEKHIHPHKLAIACTHAEYKTRCILNVHRANLNEFCCCFYFYYYYYYLRSVRSLSFIHTEGTINRSFSSFLLNNNYNTKAH